MSKFEQYLNQFSNTIDFSDFVVGFLLTAILAILIRLFYIRFGTAISNRQRFSNNFLALALIVMLIITIVKSSLALSLGLVGALSIVRFRAAIKDPEELTYLFLVIGLGLATGANQFMLALFAIPSILVLLWLYYKFTGKSMGKSGNKMFVNIKTKETSIKKVSDILIATLPHVELKRMDTVTEGLELTFICKADSVDQIEQVKDSILGLDSSSTLSIIDQPDMIV